MAKSNVSGVDESENTPMTEEDRMKGMEVDIARYFNNAPRTIFDEIVTPTKQTSFNVETTGSEKFSEFDGLTHTSRLSGNFFSTDTLLRENDGADDVTVNDAQRDAWIPSERTRKVLRSVAASAGGGNLLDRDNLTMPGMTEPADLPDMIVTGANVFLCNDGSVPDIRDVLTASDVTQDERGLRNLIQSGCYKAAVNLSRRLLSIYAQGYGKIGQPSKHTPHSLQLWYTRLSLLTKLREVDILKEESKPFGNLDKPDMYFTFYPELYGTRPGSMASFAFRLLLAEVPMYCGSPKRALDNLYALLATVNRIIENFQSGLGNDGNCIRLNPSEQKDAVRLWQGRKSRVLISIINSAVSTKNYVLAIDMLQTLCSSYDWTDEQLRILSSAIGRVHLFLGDVLAAEKLLVCSDKSGNATNVRILVDRGLMAVAQNSFQEAYNCFQTASSLDPSNVMLVNNMAVCLLYTGQLKAAVHLYENLVARNPVKSLQEHVLLNMCTSYELHTTHCKQTKLHLLRQLYRYKGDAIDIHCLKLPAV